MEALRLSEKFYSIQGEGPFSGVPALFLRVLGCNLRCVWCDSPYTWDRWGISRYGDGRVDEGFPYTFEEFTEDTARYSLIVPTGGEPLLYSDIWEAWIREVEGETLFQFETNGTFPPILTDDRRVHFVVSPKFPDSGNPDAIELDVLRRYVPLLEEGRAFFKFVITDAERDEENVRDLLHRLNLPEKLWLFSVFVMPEGVDPTLPIAREVAGMALRNGWRYSDRLHIRLWGNVRGK